MRVQVDVRIRLRDGRGRKFLGIGGVWLLQGIAEHGSIREAARHMELSYPKALVILGSLERGLGQEVVARHKGGSGRGGAELTPPGRDLLRRVERAQARIQRYAEGVIARAFARPLAGGGRRN